MEEDFSFRSVPKPKHKKKKKLKNIPKAIRTFVRERDHHQCVVCGSKNDLQLHHLIPKGRFNPKYYNLEHVHDPRNLATVCCWCHRDIHDSPEKMEAMLAWQKLRFGRVRKERDEIGE